MMIIMIVVVIQSPMDTRLLNGIIGVDSAAHSIKYKAIWRHLESSLFIQVNWTYQSSVH